ncbi:MAG TPA: hypothetical protein VFZ53_14310, partial [Polyangiaceae bacterium]
MGSLGRLAAGLAVALVTWECGGRSAVKPFGRSSDASGGSSGAAGSTASGGASSGGTGTGATGGSSVGGAFGGTASGGVAGVGAAGAAAGVGGVGGRAGSAGVSGGGSAGEGGLAGEGGTPGEGGEGGGGDAPYALGLALGAFHSCARFADGTLRCWGTSGYIGSGNTATIGDNETPEGLPPVVIGGAVMEVVAGWYQTCARLEAGNVRCFGRGGDWGLLGYGNTDDVGDDETPTAVGDVNVGGPARSLSAGPNHTCAVLTDGALRCWGRNGDFQLGRPGGTVGDDEAPASVPAIEVGEAVLDVATGFAHTCAVITGNRVRCWGNGYAGRLGYGNTRTIGDDETPASAGDVDVGGPVRALVAGAVHTCALLMDRTVRCWGSGETGVLGYGNTQTIGDDETPASAGPVDVGGRVAELAAGDFATCARLVDGNLRCWGSGERGELGHGDTTTIGDDETPASVDLVDVGPAPDTLDVGFLHVCATLL